MKTAIKKMIIELNGKDVELTMAQARELHAALGELFDEKVREIRVPDPYPVYRRPYVWPWREPIWTSRIGSRFQVSSGNDVIRCQLKSG